MDHASKAIVFDTEPSNRMPTWHILCRRLEVASNQTKKEYIRLNNDIFRRYFIWDNPIPGRILFTPGFCQLEPSLQKEFVSKVKSFNEFPEDNDPHGEHDFGEVEINDIKVFWKIDYYDEKYEDGSNDPSDTSRTKRVLTVMLAEES